MAWDLEPPTEQELKNSSGDWTSLPPSKDELKRIGLQSIPEQVVESAISPEAFAAYGQAAGSLLGPIGAGVGQAAGRSLGEGIAGVRDLISGRRQLSDEFRLPTAKQVGQVAGQAVQQFNEGAVFEMGGQLLGKGIQAIAQARKASEPVGKVTYKQSVAGDQTQEAVAGAQASAKQSAQVDVAPSEVETSGQLFKVKAPTSLKELENWKPDFDASELPSRSRLEDISKSLEINTKPLKYHFDMLDNPKAMKALKLEFENLPTESAQKISLYNQSMLNESARNVENITKKIANGEPKSLGDAGESFIQAVIQKNDSVKKSLAPAFEEMKKNAISLSPDDGKALIQTIGQQTKTGSLLKKIEPHDKIIINIDSVEKTAESIAKRLGGRPDGTGQNSYYYRLPNGERLRVSDHYFPRLEGNGVAHVEVIIDSVDGVAIRRNKIDKYGRKDGPEYDWNIKTGPDYDDSYTSIDPEYKSSEIYQRREEDFLKTVQESIDDAAKVNKTFTLGENKPRFGLTDDEYKAMKEVIDDLNDGVSFEEIQNIRERLRNIEDPMKPKATAEVSKLRKVLLDALESSTPAEVRPAMKEYAINERARDSIEQIIGGKIEDLNRLFLADPDKVVKKIFSNKNYAQVVQDYVGKDAVDDMLSAYVNNGIQSSFDSVRGFVPEKLRQWLKTNKTFLQNYVDPKVSKELADWADYGYLAKRFMDDVNPSGTAASLAKALEPQNFAQRLKAGGVRQAITSEITSAVETKAKQKQAIKAVNEALGGKPEAPKKSVLDKPRSVMAGVKKEAALLDSPDVAAKVAERAVPAISIKLSEDLKSEEKWVNTGARKIKEWSSTIKNEDLQKLAKTKKGRDLLIRAGDLNPESKEFQKIIEDIKSQFPPQTKIEKPEFPMAVKKGDLVAMVQNKKELEEALSEGWA